MRRIKKRTGIITIIIVFAAVILTVGIIQSSRERYEFPFDAGTIDHITLFHGCEETESKDIRDPKDIRKIVSSLQSLKVYSWKEVDFPAGNEGMICKFHLSDGTNEEISYQYGIGKGVLLDKTGETRVSYLPADKLWQKLKTETNDPSN